MLQIGHSHEALPDWFVMVSKPVMGSSDATFSLATPEHIYRRFLNLSLSLYLCICIHTYSCISLFISCSLNKCPNCWVSASWHPGMGGMQGRWGGSTAMARGLRFQFFLSQLASAAVPEVKKVLAFVRWAQRIVAPVGCSNAGDDCNEFYSPEPNNHVASSNDSRPMSKLHTKQGYQLKWPAVHTILGTPYGKAPALEILNPQSLDKAPGRLSSWPTPCTRSLSGFLALASVIRTVRQRVDGDSCADRSCTGCSKSHCH